MKKKGQSGKSRKTKVISFRLENDKHKKLTKLAGGKKRLNGWVKRRMEELAS